MKNQLKSESSRVYKVTFVNGDTHYGRVVLSKNYSAKTYLSDMAGRVLINANNPLRVNMTTEVEKRIHSEYSTTKCEVVFEGPTAEAIEVKDKLAQTDLNSLNLRINVTMGESKDTLKVPMKHTKVMRSISGEVMNFISVSYARTHQLVKFLNETKRHPLDNTFTQILVPIERY